MGFVLLAVVTVAAVFAGLAFHRFRTTRAEASANILYAEILKEYSAWVVRMTVEASRRASPEAWLGYLKSLPLWRLPLTEKWLFLCLYGSFLYLAASGFFFAFFIPRGLFGLPLIAHVIAGGLFAASLTVVVIFRARDFTSAPRPLSLTAALLDPRRLGITAARVKFAAFWIFVLAGLLLTVSAFLPMLPLLHTSGQKAMFVLHRLSALASVLAAMVFVGLEPSAAGRPSS